MVKHVQMLLFFCGVFMTSVLTLKWTNVPVELGHHAILPCSLDEQNIIWHRRIEGQTPVQILRTYNKKVEVVTHFSKTFKERYSVKLGNHLFIQNTTVEDMTLFYCTHVDNTTFSNEIFHLVSGIDCKLQTKDCPWYWYLTHWPMVVSLVLNAILITALTGFCIARCHNRPKAPDPVYETIQPSSSTYETIRKNPASGPASTDSNVQQPPPTAP